LELPHRLGEVPRALADGRVMSPSHRHRKALRPPQREAYGARERTVHLVQKDCLACLVLFREMPDAVCKSQRQGGTPRLVSTAVDWRGQSVDVQIVTSYYQQVSIGSDSAHEPSISKNVARVLAGRARQPTGSADQGVTRVAYIALI
jgi:uncharacterized protein YciU (UPF0263 family)